MRTRLSWQTAEGGLVLRLQGEHGPVPFSQGASAPIDLDSGGQASVGSVLRLLDAERVHEAVPGEILVPHALLADPAQLSRVDLKGLGLPSGAPFTVQIESSGLLTDASFRLRCRLWHLEGRPVMAPRRTGALLTVGDHQFVLRDPIFSLLERAEELERCPPGDMDGRFRAWAAIRELLPPEAKVSEGLLSIRVAVAESLTLKPFINQRGEPDFDPVVGRVRATGDDADDQKASFLPTLPEKKLADFAGRFRGLRAARPRYVLGDDWFLVLAPPLQKALDRVRELQNASPAERRSVLRTPRAFLRTALEGQLSEPEIESVFYDEDYGERVKGIGIWQPKVLPWITVSGIKWLPDSGEPPTGSVEVGIQVGEERLTLTPEEVPHFQQALERARQSGEPDFEYRGLMVPATEGTASALAAIARQVDASKPGLARPADPEGPSGRTVLLVVDHLDALGTAAAPAARRPTTWGAQVPARLRTRLMPHQVACFEWLQQHWTSGSRGALLADDMGLGKTLSTLAFLAWLRDGTDSRGLDEKPILVVAPTGLLRNWRDEHDNHLHGDGLGRCLNAYGSHLAGLRSGTSARGSDVRVGVPSLDVLKLRDASWVLTSYESLRDYQLSFGKVHWRAVVFDEAQRIKNPAAAVTDAAKAIEADFRLALTGTPVENRLADLWCIVDAIQPGSLGTLREFSNTVEAAVGQGDQGPLTRLHNRLLEQGPPTLAVRRLKEDHIDGLPEREEHVLTAVMPEEQAGAYESEVQKGRQRTDRAAMLEALQGLRRVSLHPNLAGNGSDEQYVSQSARLSLVLSTLDQISAANEKALVFVEFLEMQDVLVGLLQRRYRLPAPPLIINGDVPGDRRKERVNAFQQKQGFDVMLLSPRAGGVGLTLTAANHVLHLSRWWNPAVEDQCSDRVYRIGQGKKVHVYYPLAVHPRYRDESFDFRLNELLSRKRQLSRKMLAPPSLTTEELASLYRSAIRR